MKQILNWTFLLLFGALAPREVVAAQPRNLADIYPGLAALRAATSDFVCLVDTENVELRLSQIGDRPAQQHPMEQVRRILEREAGGAKCFLVHATLLTPQDLARPRLQAIVVYGRSKPAGPEADKHLFALIRECKVSLLCVGGAQSLLVQAYGGKIGNIRKLKPGETDPDPSYVPGWFKEVGYLPVRIVERDPLFEGLGEKLVVYQRHASEVKELPSQFKVLASTDECRVQVCRHKDKPHYGVVFAPDRFDAAHPDGRQILKNFFALATKRPQSSSSVGRPLEEIYPGVAELRTTTESVICLVDTEHPEERRKVIGDRPPNVHPLESLRMRLELEWAGLRCLLVHPSLLQPGDLARPQVKAVLVWPRTKSAGAAADKQLFALIRACRAPMLFSGGAQALLVQAYGGKIGNIRKLKPGEPDPDPSYVPGWFKETGYLPVRIVERDPLFEGLGEKFVVYQRHASEVKELPSQFKVLASTEECRVQVCRHKDKPHYGVVFAPERFNEQYPDGKRILQNFFRLAGIEPERELPKARAAARARIRQIVGGVCQDPRVARQQTKPFVVLVDIEGPEAVASTRRGSGSGMTHAEKIEQFRTRIEKELAHLPCIVVHHAELTREDFTNPNLRAIVLTGATSPSVKPLCQDLFAVIREGNIPVLGVCAGHQHIGLAHGMDTELMRMLRPGEKDPNPKYHPGRFKEWGFLPVQIIQRDPLFDGLPDTIVVQEYHVGKIKSLPAEFELLARTDECEIQAMKRRGKPVYGTQFHPENYDDEHPHGKRLLQNFFRIAAQTRRP